LTTPDKTFVIPNEITDLGFTYGPDLSHYDLSTIQKLYEAAQRLVDDYTGDLEVLEAREATRLPAHTHIDEVESVRFKQKAYNNALEALHRYLNEPPESRTRYLSGEVIGDIAKEAGYDLILFTDTPTINFNKLIKDTGPPKTTNELLSKLHDVETFISNKDLHYLYLLKDKIMRKTLGDDSNFYMNNLIEELADNNSPDAFAKLSDYYTNITKELRKSNNEFKQGPHELAVLNSEIIETPWIAYAHNLDKT